MLRMQITTVKCLFDATLQLAVSSRPQDGTTAAYILRFLLRLPSFQDVLRERSTSQSLYGTNTAAAAAAAADDVDDDDDAHLRCVQLLLQLLRRQLDVATVNLLEVTM